MDNVIVYLIVGGVIGILYHVLIEHLIKRELPNKILRGVGTTFIVSLVGVLIHWHIELLHKQEVIAENLDQVRQVASTFRFYKAFETIQGYTHDNTFRKLLEEEVQYTKDRIAQIEQGELNLSREEVIPKWESLIGKHTKREIKATNIVSINDWKQFSPNEGSEVHQDALKRNVKIKRLFIYDGNDSINTVGTQRLAKYQNGIGIEVRMIDKNWIDKSSYVSGYLRELGTIDIVIFDSECALLTNVDYQNGSYKIIKGTVTNNPLKIKTASDIFDKLWKEGKTLNEFLKLHR